MKALAVRPGAEQSAELVDVAAPDRAEGALLVRSLAVGICGTDLEIVHGLYGQAPLGEERLVIGHESVGEVVEAPAGTGFTPGQLVVGVVRRPDPETCDHCAVGEWDMCRSVHFRECGIKEEHGYAREMYRLDEQFAVAVDSRLGEVGVLVEPASVVAKACTLAIHLLKRTQVQPKTALITGAGPIGLLAALATSQYGLETHVVDIVDDGPKPELVRSLGARYYAASPADLDISPDIVIECTGIGSVLRAAGSKAAPGGVIALTGLSAVPSTEEVDLSLFNKNMVMQNKVVFGSVNAARSHYEMAARVLAGADLGWLKCLISRRVPVAQWREALERQPDDVKVVLEMSAGGRAT